MKLYTTDNEGTSLIKPGSWIESSSLHLLNLQIKSWAMFFELIVLQKMFFKLNIISDTVLLFLLTQGAPLGSLLSQKEISGV